MEQVIIDKYINCFDDFLENNFQINTVINFAKFLFIWCMCFWSNITKDMYDAVRSKQRR